VRALSITLLTDADQSRDGLISCQGCAVPLHPMNDLWRAMPAVIASGVGEISCGCGGLRIEVARPEA